MRKSHSLLVFLLALLILSVPSAYAQDGVKPTLTPTATLTPTPTPTVTPTATIEPIPQLPPVPPYHLMGISVEADDGLILYGDLYLVDSARITGRASQGNQEILQQPFAYAKLLG